MYIVRKKMQKISIYAGNIHILSVFDTEKNILEEKKWAHHSQSYEPFTNIRNFKINFDDYFYIRFEFCYLMDLSLS